MKKVLQKSQQRIDQIRKDYINKKAVDKNKSQVEDLRSKSNTRIGMGINRHLSQSKSKDVIQVHRSIVSPLATKSRHSRKLADTS